MPWFEYLKDKSITMTYHNSEKSFPAGKNYFQACQGYGQEFVVSPGVADNPELNWENCSFCEIFKNLEKIYPKKENNQ